MNAPTKITLGIPPLDIAACLRLRGGNGYEDPLESICPDELDAAICITDGPGPIQPEPPELPDPFDLDGMNDSWLWDPHDDDHNDDQGENNQDQGYNKYTAAAYAREHALNGSHRRCAEFVLNALAAGGFDIGESGNRNKEFRIQSAHQMDETVLRPLGFERVDGVGYEPQIGDVLVIERLEGYYNSAGEWKEGHPDGHTAIYDGFNWISDFVQQSMWGLRDAQRYIDNNEFEYSIWRY